MPRLERCPIGVCASEHGVDIDELERRAWDAGVAVQDGRMFYGPCAMRINVALPMSRVEEAMRRLSEYVFVD